MIAAHPLRLISLRLVRLARGVRSVRDSHPLRSISLRLVRLARGVRSVRDLQLLRLSCVRLLRLCNLRVEILIQSRSPMAAKLGIPDKVISVKNA